MAKRKTAEDALRDKRARRKPDHPRPKPPPSPPPPPKLGDWVELDDKLRVPVPGVRWNFCPRCGLKLP